MVIYTPKQICHLDPYTLLCYNVITQAASKFRKKGILWLKVFGKVFHFSVVMFKILLKQIAN